MERVFKKKEKVQINTIENRKGRMTTEIEDVLITLRNIMNKQTDTNLKTQKQWMNCFKSIKYKNFNMK